MKLKYIIPSLIAVVALLVSCSEKFEPSYLDGLRVSSSYVVVPADGGSADFTINASGDWEIKDIPAWLTITPTSGGAGQTKVVASAPATTSTNNATVKIMFGTNFQEVNLVQTAKKTEPIVWSITQGLAQLKANPDGLSATVKGVVCKIEEISPQYGNATYYLSDDGKFGDGNWIEVFRGKWLDGASFTKGDEFAVGDEIVVTGSLIYYNKTVPEFSAGSSVVSISKSLIGIEKVEMLDVEEGEGKTEFVKEGGKAKITVMTKGNGFHISIPAEAKSWLHIDDFGANYVTLAADANDGGARKATVTLSTESEGTTYTCEQTFTQLGGITECTVAEFLAAEVGDAQYRLTGVITELYTSDKQGKSFYVADHTGSVLVYRAEGFIEAGAKVGDVVTVMGQRGAYNNNPQMVKGTFESIMYAVTPVTIGEFRNAAVDNSKYYLITGTINKVAEADKGAKDDIEKYGNFDLKDDTGSIYVYGVLSGWKGAKGKFAELELTYGDQLTIIAKRAKYNQLEQAGSAVYVSHKKAN